MHTKESNGESAAVLELPGDSPKLNTILELPSGAIAVKKQLKGRDFFKFQDMAGKNAADALKWVVMQAFEVDGKALTIDQLEDDFDFEDVAVLVQEINKAFLPYLPADKRR